MCSDIITDKNDNKSIMNRMIEMVDYENNVNKAFLENLI
jgi:hypothetical protein